MKRPVWKRANPMAGLTGLQCAGGGRPEKEVARLNGFKLEVAAYGDGMRFYFIAWGEPTFNSLWDGKIFDSKEAACLAAEDWARAQKKGA